MEQKTPRESIPEDYLCTITGEVLFDPVVVVESGHSYEREAILGWFQNHSTDPQSRTPLVSKNIIDNHSLKRIILQYLSKHPRCYQDEEVYIPIKLKEDLFRSIQETDVRLYRDCLSKHPGLLYASLNSEGKTLCELLLIKNHQEMLGQFLLKLLSTGEKQFIEALSTYKKHYYIFCLILVLSKDELAPKGLHILLSQLEKEELDKRDEKGLCLIHYAANSGNLQSLELLISRGADPLRVVGSDEDAEAEEGNGLNPFMIACAKGFTNITMAYLSGSPTVNLSAITTYKGKEVKEVRELYYFAADCTAAQLAAFYGHQAVLEQLMSRDPEILFQVSKDENEDKLTLLDFAILGNQSKIVSWLLTLKKFTENFNLDRQKSFERAVKGCSKEIVLILWEYGFRPPELKNLLHDALGFLSYDIDTAREDEKRNKFEKFQTIYQTLINLGADLDVRVRGNHLIHVAARNSLTEIVIFLLKAGVKPDIENDDDETILMIALEDDNLSLFNELLRYSVNIHRVDSNGNTLVHLARSKEIIDALLSRGLDVNALNKNKKTPLIYHLADRRFATAQYLLERNADVSPIDEEGKSALFYVCQRSYWGDDNDSRKDCLQSILAKNPDVKVVDKDGDTVLHRGLDISIIEPIVKYLNQYCSANAEIASFLNIQNKKGNTVLMDLCKNSWSGSLTANFLLDNGVDPKLENSEGKQAIHFLFENIGSDSQYKLAFAERLLDEGVDVNVPINQDGAQPLHIAVEKKSESAVRWLLEHGASKVSLCKRGENYHVSAVELTLQYKNKSLLIIFLDSGYDVNHKSSKHSYALIHWAVHHNCKDKIFDLLISRKADVELADDWGFTPLLRAANNGCLSPFNYLIKYGASITKVTLLKKNILHLIAEEGRLSLLEPLKSLDITALVDAKDANGLTPVCHAAKKKQLVVLKSLVTDFKASLATKEPGDDSVMKYAIESGDDEVCGYLLDQQSLMNEIASKATELLFEAIQSKVSDSICERIASLCVDLNARSDDEEAVLFCAAKNKRYQFMRYLIGRGVRLDETYEENIYDNTVAPRRGRGRRVIGQIFITTFYELIKDLEEDINEDTEIYKTIECLIKKGANPMILNSVEGKCHLLAILVEKGLLNLVKLFIRSGVNVKSIDKEWPLLQYPAASGNLELARLLVEQGAIIDIESDYNPIVIAAACGHQEIAELFISKWPSCVAIPGKIMPDNTKNHLHLVEENFDEDDEIDVLRHSKISAIHAAILEDHDELIPFLVQKAVPVDIMCQALTPIQLAIVLNNRSSISKLLEHAPNLFVLREGSKTLLHLMLEYADIETIKLFKISQLRKWADISDALGDKPLHYATKDNKQDVLEYLLKLSVNSNSKGAQNKTALHYAVMQDKENLVHMLLDNGADPDLQDSEGCCALHYVKSVSVVRSLLQYPSAQKCINLQDVNGNTPLHVSRSFEVVCELLDHGANPAIENSKGQNSLFALLADSAKPKDRFKIAEKIFDSDLIDACNTVGKAIIHVVCENNDLEAVEWVCKNYADINAQTHDEDGNTPLAIAIASGSDDILRALIQFGADVTKPRKKFTLTPLVQSIWFSDNTKTIRLLLNHVSRDVVNSLSDVSALYYAIFFNRVEVFKAFLNHGINIEITDPKGKNILHYIAEKDAVSIYQCLSTEQVAKLNVPDNNGNSPLQCGLEANKEKICELLLSTGLMISETNNNRETILHASIKGRVSTSLLDKIFKSGVDVDAKDKSGNTALIQSALCKDYDRLKYLINKGCKIELTNKSGHSVLRVLCEQLDEKVQEDSDIYSVIRLILKTANKEDLEIKNCLRRVISKNSIVVTQLFEKEGLKLVDLDNEKSLLVPLERLEDDTLNIAMLGYLIQQGVNVNHADFPLAVQIGTYIRGFSNLELISMLVENGADVNQVLKEAGKTMSLLTALCGIGENAKDVTEDKIYPLVMFLLDKGAKVNYLDDTGDSALHLAARCNFTQIAKLLIDRGANTKLRNNKGQTPMKTAREAKHDPNYLYIHIDEREHRQKTEISELHATVTRLEKQNEILKNSFAHYRRMTEAELQALRQQLQGYNPRFVGNFSSLGSVVCEVSEQKAEQENYNMRK